MKSCSDMEFCHAASRAAQHLALRIHDWDTVVPARRGGGGSLSRSDLVPRRGGLTGWQRPDHNTLWRFYQAHRHAMRPLLKHTARTAVAVGLVDLAVQAIDGTKVASNPAGDGTYDDAGLERLLARTDATIKELEAQNEGGDDPPPPRLPEEHHSAQGGQVLRERVHLAVEHLTKQGLRRVNLTDEDAQLMKGQQGIMPAYNAQTTVSPLDPAKASGSGMLITAADVVNKAADSAQLSPMPEESKEMTEVHVPITLAGGGYHTAKNLEAGEHRGDVFVMPERYHPGVQGPYFKDRFVYDADTDSYVCPQGGRLPFRGIRRANGKSTGPFRVYCAPRAMCRACPAYGSVPKTSTPDAHCGSDPRMTCSANIDGGWQRRWPGVCMPGERD